MVEAAVGVVPRTMVAVLVVVAAPAAGPALLDRREISLVTGDLPGQAYHAAAGLPLPDGERLIRRWAQAACAAVAGEIAEIIRNLATPPAGPPMKLVAAGIAATVRSVPPLASVLRSHPRWHAGEGQLAREAVAEAAAQAGLPVHYLDPRGERRTALQDRVRLLGHGLGPPWRAEQKLATAAALHALHAVART